MEKEDLFFLMEVIIKEYIKKVVLYQANFNIITEQNMKERLTPLPSKDFLMELSTSRTNLNS